MHKRKLQTAVAAVALLGMISVGCSSNGNGGGDDGGNGDATAERTLRLSHQYNSEHPVEVCGVPAIQKSLEGSGLKVESFPSGSIGSEAESLEQLVLGDLDMAVAGGSFLAQWEPKAAVFDAPFVFSDIDHFEETLNGPIAEEIWDSLEEKQQMRVMATWYYGTRHVTSKNPVHTSADLSGQKLRAADAPLYITMAEIMGGTPTPMALGEAYLGLQQGTIDAQENPIPTINSQKFYEVQDYINITGHMIQGVMLITNTQLLSSLPDEQVQALETAIQDASAEVRRCTEEQEQDFLKKWEEEGTIKVNRDVDFDHFKDRAKEMIPANPDFADWVDLYEQIQGQ